MYFRDVNVSDQKLLSTWKSRSVWIILLKRAASTTACNSRRGITHSLMGAVRFFPITKEQLIDSYSSKSRNFKDTTMLGCISKVVKLHSLRCTEKRNLVTPRNINWMTCGNSPNHFCHCERYGSWISWFQGDLLLQSCCYRILDEKPRSERNPNVSKRELTRESTPRLMMAYTQAQLWTWRYLTARPSTHL